MPPGHDGRVRGSAASGWSPLHILLWSVEVSSDKVVSSPAGEIGSILEQI